MDTFKFVDDVIVTETIDQSNISRMQSAADRLPEWSYLNFMNINTKKTEEMLFGPILQSPPPLIVFNISTVERVTSFKLLDVTCNYDEQSELGEPHQCCVQTLVAANIS
jgi:hypothetical protein